MAHTNHISMNHETGATILVVIILNVGHFISATIAPIFTVLSGIYILYNIRLQVVAAGGIIPYLKGWLKWKK